MYFLSLTPAYLITSFSFPPALPPFLFPQRSGKHSHPRGWPVVCHHAKINAISLSRSLGHEEGGTSLHLFVIIVCPSALGSAGRWAWARLFVCCPPDVACPWRGCSFVPLLLQYLIYFQYSQKKNKKTEARLDLWGHWQTGEMKNVKPGAPVLSIVTAGLEPPSLTSSWNKWCQREKTEKKRKKHIEKKYIKWQRKLINLTSVIALHDLRSQILVTLWEVCCAEWIYNIYTYILWLLWL